MAEYTFQNFLSLNEFREKSGYDLTKSGRLELGDFSNQEEAAKCFMQDCYDELVNEIIKPNRGIYWTKNFIIDMQSSEAESNEILADMKRGFIEALKQHIIYRFEVGDPVACANKDVPKYSEHMLNALANSRIIVRGV